MPDSRSEFFALELIQLEKEVRDCQLCGGTGITGKAIRSRLTKFNTAYEDIDAAESRRAARLKKKEDLYSKTKKENPENSSFGLCECRIKTEALKQLTIGNIPHKFYKMKYSDIIARDVSIVGLSTISVELLAKSYVGRIDNAMNSAIGLNLMAPYGYGKTWLAHFIAARVIKKRYTAHYTPLFLVLDLFARNGIYDKLLQEIMSVDLLVLDDIGNEQQSRMRSCSEFAFLLQQRIARGKINICVFNEIKKREAILEIYGPIFYGACTSRNMDIMFRTRITDEKANTAAIRKLMKKLI